ncbi:MAG: NAD-dependent succinate-semialdehyde dehydrogenase [Bacteroidota bacterium]
MFTTINPATGKNIRSYSTRSSQDIDEQLQAQAKAQKEWALVTYERRADYLRKMAETLREKAGEYGALMTQEMGKPLAQGVSEAEKCAWVCDYYADNGADFLADEVIETDARTSYVTQNPLGVVLAIMPWNFPFWQLFRFGAPALMAGNAVALKHAPNVCGCAEAIEQLMKDVGVPEHLFKNYVVEIEQVKGMIAHDAVRAVTLTGSTRAGRAVASQAGAHLKKTVLELGGSDPYIIMDDADLKLAAEKCVTSRLINSGQSCIAAKRFIVTRKNAEKFTELVHDLMISKSVGDPTEEITEIGPMSRADLRDELHEQVEQSIEAGAKRLLGGSIPDKEGFYYPATILTNVEPGMPAFDEELFGPVASIITADDEEHALELANQSAYGLGAAIFTQDLDRGEVLAAQYLEAGCCFVNDFVRSDPRLPFGGVKDSGYGRELSHHGIKEFVNTKTVYIA